MTEKEKYLGIYSSENAHYRRYGHSNHGAAAVAILRADPPSSLVDIGCGWNEFAIDARQSFPGVKITGVDFACPGADVNADATRLPFGRKSYDALTAFDMLEHLLPAQVAPALAEFARVSRRFVFSISYADSVYRWEGATLHPTVRDEQWWMEQIRLAGGTPVKHGRYICGTWVARPIEPRERVILIGNGPSVLAGDFGAQIDAFDQVVRFNQFAIAGFEKKVGTRTDLWSTFGRGMVPKDENQRPQRIIFTHGEKPPHPLPFPVEQIYGIPRPFHDALRWEVKARTARVAEAKDKLLPTSGLTVAMWLLREHGLKSLVLHGFDHFSKVNSSQHHYWVPKAFGKPGEHDGEVEAEILAETGRVQYLPEWVERHTLDVLAHA